MLTYAIYSFGINKADVNNSNLETQITLRVYGKKHTDFLATIVMPLSAQKPIGANNKSLMDEK